ncbi:MAG: (d)CMP kinase [Phycisphaerae bacterium]|nr:(d)CMP kinase [Phycisphaerae bacterium]
MAQLIITIDGPAGVGKSTISRRLAEHLDAIHLDTGAMYRAVTLAAMRANIDLTDPVQIRELIGQTEFHFEADHDDMRVWIDNREVTNEIRDPQVTEKVKHVASMDTIRHELVEWQQRFANDYPRIVTEGRDQGTVVFPNATVKFFLTADPSERARRRQLQWKESGIKVPLEQILQDIETRDASDRTRATGPLVPAENAVIVDTTRLSIDEVIEVLLTHIPETA